IRPAAFQSLLAPPQGTTGHGTGGDVTAIESPTFPDPSPPAARPVLVGKCRKPPECHRNFTAADLPPPATIFVDPGTRDRTGPQERPSGGLASLDQDWTDVYGHPVYFSVSSVHLTLPREFRGRSDRECQDLRLGRLGVLRPARICGSADFVSPRPANRSACTRHPPLGHLDFRAFWFKSV
ncbi:2-oxoglutarate and Fe(II)-dependent oxygenase superfamily protein, partial [Prunus dulcis]